MKHTLCDFTGVKPPAALNWRPDVVSETRGARMVCSGRYRDCADEDGQRREQLVDLEKYSGETKARLSTSSSGPR